MKKLQLTLEANITLKECETILENGSNAKIFETIYIGDRKFRVIKGEIIK